MANPCFRFKKFTVYHDRCAMKVGTDGVLVGAWAGVKQAHRILDIGTGTGLIALMAAQRSKAYVTGVEIDGEAAQQARENVERSPWKERISIVHTDLKQFGAEDDILRYDAIISNPPYFVDALKCPDNGRSTARHNGELTFRDLMYHVVRLLDSEGEFSLIIPSASVAEMVGLAMEHGLHLSRKAWVQTTPAAAPKRCMLAFRFIPTESVEERTVIIQHAPSVYDDSYRELTKEFYLKF